MLVNDSYQVDASRGQPFSINSKHKNQDIVSYLPSSKPTFKIPRLPLKSVRIKEKLIKLKMIDKESS